MNGYPEESEVSTITAEEAGFDAGRLDAAVQFAREAGTAQLVILARGRRLVDETFSDEPVDVFAVQKGLVALLVGIAIDRGMLSLDDPSVKYLPTGWTSLDPRMELRLMLRHLLTMTTGMDDNLAPLGVMGKSWRYNNIAYNYLKRILSERSGVDFDELTSSWLTAKLGMTRTRWVERGAKLPDARPLTGLLSTASDLARLGLLVLQGGEWGKGQLVTREYVDTIALPGSEDNPAWGLLWWNNNQGHFRRPMREEKLYAGNIIPAAPNDLIAARGAFENHLGVVPSLNLVVARTTKPVANGGRALPFERSFYERLAASVAR